MKKKEICMCFSQHSLRHVAAARANRLSDYGRNQTGITLIELMVGIAVGLMVVAVAFGALMMSRNYSGTTADATQLQQQAAYAFRVLGQQIRQAGSVQLNLDPNRTSTSTTALDPATPVALISNYGAISQIVQGMDTPGTDGYALSVGYQNYFEKQQNSSDTNKNTMFRDCLGGGGAPNSSGVYFPIISHFSLRGGNLVCAGAADANGTAGTAQPIIQNVNGFQIQYFLQENTSTGSPTIRRTNAAGVSNWANVFAIEICLDLIGERSIDLPTTSTYQNCSDTATSYGGRIHQVFRNVFQIRSQGVFN
jgi:type IV pilus assembly protein PilW